MALRKARKQLRAFKGSIQGPSGSGKTYSALNILTPLVAMSEFGGKRIAVIDTDKGAEVYSPPFDFDVDDDFGVGTKVNFHPDRLIEKLDNILKIKDEHGKPVYGGVIVDSATHFYKEAGGILSMVDAICDAERAKGKSPNTFTAWKQVDKKYREMMSYFRSYPLHILLCIRSKQEYKHTGGKVEKLGLAPEFREGFEFEMDAQFAVNEEHILVPLKHRLGKYLDGKSWVKPGLDVAEVINEWANDGSVKVEPTPSQVEPTEAPPAPREPEKHADENYLEKHKAAILAATTRKELSAAGQAATAAKKAGHLSPEEFKTITAVFTAHQATLPVEG